MTGAVVCGQPRYGQRADIDLAERAIRKNFRTDTERN